MSPYIGYVLTGWVVVSLGLFASLRPARATMVCVIGGWLLLPTAHFPLETAGDKFPDWIMGVALPSSLGFDKALAIGLGLLAGMAVFDRSIWRSGRWHWLDGVMIVWCLTPAASAIRNDVAMGDAAFAVAHQLLGWGALWWAGRVYFCEPDALRDLVAATVAASMIMLPLALLEMTIGPVWYKLAYGFHPFQFDGSVRAVGYRPIMMTEHGNQLGIWYAGSAVAAAWLWYGGAVRRILHVPIGLAALMLIGATLGFQSAGAILLMGMVLGVMWVAGRWRSRWLWIAVLAVPILYAGLRVTNLVQVKQLQHTAVGAKVKQLLKSVGRGSFGWRLKLEEEHQQKIWKRPMLGYGQPLWWRDAGGHPRPWGLWMLTWGMYGAVGLAAMYALLLGPLGMLVWNVRPDQWSQATHAAAAAAGAMLAMHVLDTLLNGTLVMVVVCLAGAMVSTCRRSRGEMLPNTAG